MSIKQYGEITPGKEACFIISVTGGDSSALRVWMGDKNATGTMKTKTNELEPGKYDADLEIPTGGGKLWLEIEGKTGKTSGSIEVK